MAKARQNLQQELGKLRNTYLKRLTGTVAELRRTQVMLASTVRVPLADLQTLYKISNDLAGSGATYGFPKISQTGRVLNDSVKALLDTDGNSDQFRKETLYRLEVFQSACVSALQDKPVKTVGRKAASLDGRSIALLCGNSTIADFYAHVLQQGGAAISKLNAIDDLDSQADVLVFDLSDKTPAETQKIQVLRARQPDLTIIVLLDKEQAEIAEDLIGQVDDFLFNPFTPKILQLIILNRLAITGS